MHNPDSESQALRETLWRRPWTPAERAALEGRWAHDPDARRAWEEEAVLTHSLSKLPDVPAPSNLTARVLAAIDRDSSPAPTRGLRAWWDGLGAGRWAVRCAALMVLATAVWLVRQQQHASQRAQLARSIAEVADLAAAAPDVETLKDFAVIRNLTPPTAADEDLLALLQ